MYVFDFAAESYFLRYFAVSFQAKKIQSQNTVPFFSMSSTVNIAKIKVFGNTKDCSCRKKNHKCSFNTSYNISLYFHVKYMLQSDWFIDTVY